jgi:hypothetical protein
LLLLVLLLVTRLQQEKLLARGQQLQGQALRLAAAAELLHSPEVPQAAALQWCLSLPGYKPLQLLLLRVEWQQLTEIPAWMHPHHVLLVMLPVSTGSLPLQLQLQLQLRLRLRPSAAAAAAAAAAA